MNKGEPVIKRSGVEDNIQQEENIVLYQDAHRFEKANVQAFSVEWMRNLNDDGKG